MNRAIGHTIFGILCLICVLATVALLLTGRSAYVGPFVIVLFATLALYCMGDSFLKSFVFTVWVFAFVAASMFYPSSFGTWFGYDLKVLIVPLIQIITFGMGTTLSTRDFERVLIMPWPVFIGIFLQFMIMPLIGYSIAVLFRFDPEVAVGVILIGSVSSGVASNVMTYLAGGDVPLSVTITSCTTLLAPFVTPFWMKILAGRFIDIDFVAMMFSIFNMIIVPIVAGLVTNKILFGKSERANRVGPLALMSVLAVLLAVGTLSLPEESLGQLVAIKSGMILGFALIALVALAKLIIGSLFKGPANWMDKALPVVSMASICLIIAIITARSRDELLTVGFLLVIAAIIHNSLGYFLGYWGARAAKLDESACRAVAMEVGMQNGGMASGIAMDVLKSTSAALAPAIFGPWMNITGSVLANWWRRKPIPQLPRVS